MTDQDCLLTVCWPLRALGLELRYQVTTRPVELLGLGGQGERQQPQVLIEVPRRAVPYRQRQEAWPSRKRTQMRGFGK